jgi:hypothetical protein
VFDLLDLNLLVYLHDFFHLVCTMFVNSLTWLYIIKTKYSVAIQTKNKTMTMLKLIRHERGKKCDLEK